MKANILQAYVKPNWPLVKGYLDRWPDSTVNCGAMPSLRYRTKLGFVLQLPRLLFFGFRIGFQALRGASAPAVFVVHTDPEVIGLALAQILRRKRVPVVICGFIYTLRKSRVVNWFRELYFRAVLAMTAGVICHSKHEAIRYSKIFRLNNTAFTSVPFALNVELSPTLRIYEGGYILSAGRAERDYGLLAEAISGLEVSAHIVCDTEAPLQSVPSLPNIKLLRQCFGGDYFREIAGADFVVVPLKDKELSAGQMVLLQSMALGKPVIISRTPTTEEYGEHLENVYFVEHGSAKAMRDAILVLSKDPELRTRIGAAARAHYLKRHTVTAYTNGVLSAVEQLVSAENVAAVN